MELLATHFQHKLISLDKGLLTTYNKTPEHEVTLNHSSSNTSPTLGFDLVDHPCNSMSDSLKNGKTAKSSVNNIVSVERDVEKRDQEVVTASQKEERNHIDDGHNTSSATDLSNQLVPGLAVIQKESAVDNVGENIDCHDEGVETSWQGSNGDGLAQLNLCVMSVVPDWGVPEVLLEFPSPAWSRPISL